MVDLMDLPHHFITEIHDMGFSLFFSVVFLKDIGRVRLWCRGLRRKRQQDYTTFGFR
jgi:hypothetical protein